MRITSTACVRFLTRPGGESLVWLATALLLAAGCWLPGVGPGMLLEVGRGLLSLLPVIALAALLASALTLGRWSDRALAWVHGARLRAVVLASLAGTVTPVCGLGVLPLIAALLRRGLPLAPVMAFWVSSPIMGPSLAVITVSIIGWPFALAKALAAFGTGLFAGAVTAALPGLSGAGHRLMRPSWLEQAGRCGAARGLRAEALASLRLAVRWLALALAVEVLVQRLVPAQWVAALFRDGQAGSIPLAALVGAPLYLDGYAALPLVRGLMEMGMGFGAALALMVSGAAVSLYAAVAVAAIVRARVFALYVVLAIAGACLSGYAAAWVR